MIEDIRKTASERWEKDVRFRAIAMSTVAHVLHEHGQVDPERADREAHDIATEVAVLLLERIFNEDAELNAQRHMADAYRKLAEDALAFAPVPLVLVKS